MGKLARKRKLAMNKRWDLLFCDCAREVIYIYIFILLIEKLKYILLIFQYKKSDLYNKIHSCSVQYNENDKHKKQQFIVVLSNNCSRLVGGLSSYYSIQPRHILFVSIPSQEPVVQQLSLFTCLLLLVFRCFYR